MARGKRGRVPGHQGCAVGHDGGRRSGGRRVGSLRWPAQAGGFMEVDAGRRSAVFGDLPLLPLAAVAEPRPVASGEGRRKADGFCVPERHHQEQALPTLRSVVFRRIRQLLLFRIRAGGDADEAFGHRAGRFVQPRRAISSGDNRSRGLFRRSGAHAGKLPEGEETAGGAAFTSHAPFHGQPGRIFASLVRMAEAVENARSSKLVPGAFIGGKGGLRLLGLAARRPHPLSERLVVLERNQDREGYDQ